MTDIAKTPFMAPYCVEYREKFDVDTCASGACDRCRPLRNHHIPPGLNDEGYAVPVGTENGGPKPFLKGAFSLYETSDGGYHLAYRPDGEDEDRHIQVPGFIAKLARAKAEGQSVGPMDMMKLLRGKGL